MAFLFWLCRLRSSKGFSYSKSRSSRSQNHATPKGRVPRHVFNSNSSRLRHPFLSLIPTALAVSAAALALQCPPNLSANCSPHHEPSEDQYHSDTDASLFSFNQYHSDTNNYDNQQHGSPLGGSSFAGSTSALALQYPPNLSSSQYHQPPENLQYHSGTNNYDNQQHGSPLQDRWDIGWDLDEAPFQCLPSFENGNEACQDTAATPNNEVSNDGHAHKNADKKKRGRERSSPVWKQFSERFKGGVKMVICNLCSMEFRRSGSGSTGHMLMHMKKCGNNEASKNEQKGDDEDTPSNYSTGMSTRKRSRTKKDDGRPRIGTRSIMVERGVSWSDIMDPTYKFIYKIFKKNEWLSLFDHVIVYPRLVQEFYHNMYPINCDSSHFYTKVSGTQLHITSKLINEVTKIPLTSDGNTPFTKFVVPPSNAELKECVHPHFEYEWEKNENKIPISYLPNQNRLLALIVMQNIWPISCNSYVPLDHAQLIYAIINHISFCLCKHMVMTMIKAHQDNTIALPFGGLITKILQAKLSSIPPTELVKFSEEDFGKALVMKFNDQLQQVHAVDEPAPLAPPAPSASSSSRPSNADVLL